MDTASAIEAILFWKGEPTSATEIARMLHVEKSEIIEGIETLRERLNYGTRLIELDNSFMLATAPEFADLFSSLEQEEETKELSKPAQETLALIVYSGPIAKQKIDYIRGVNSVFILRNLLVRGLIEKIAHPDNQRVSLYRPTIELLSRLGVTKIDELPDHTSLLNAINAFAEESNSHE